MAAARHVYETFIRATPAEVWAAITRQDFTRRYFHHTSFETDLVPGAGHRYVMADGTTAVDGTVEEVDDGRRLVVTWHVLYDAAMADEPPSRVEWELRPANPESTVTRVTLRHIDLGMSPLTSDNVELGWVGVLDSMKTLLETGEPLGDLDIEPASPADAQAGEHRRMAMLANSDAWGLLQAWPAGGPGSIVGSDDDRHDALLSCAHASSYHWSRAADPDAPEQARAAWLLARCHTIAGQVDLALHHARRCAALTETCTGAADFDRAYAHEALARAGAAAGRMDDAGRERDAAAAVSIADADDRAIFEADLAAEPWFGLGTEPLATGTGR